jgi:hypothetical protein
VQLLKDSLILPAIQGILASLLIIILMPIIGKYVESARRLTEARISIISLNLSICFGCLVTCVFFSPAIGLRLGSIGVSQEVVAYVSSFLFVILSAIAKVASKGYDLVIESDWIIALCATPTELTEMTAKLRVIDLIVDIFGSAFIGFLAHQSLLWSAIFLTLWTICSLLLEYYFLSSISATAPETFHLPKERRPRRNSRLEAAKKELNYYLTAFKTYFSTFLLPGLAFSLIHLTVLGIDTITIGYLSNSQVPKFHIGIITILCALVSAIGGSVFARFVQAHGITRTGLIGLILLTLSQALCLFVWLPMDLTISAFKVAYLDMCLANIMFIIGIILAGFGRQLIALAITQLMQQSVNPPVINGVQGSITTIMGLARYTLVAIIPDQFPILVLISNVTTCMSLALYCVFLINKKNCDLIQRKESINNNYEQI